MSKQEIIEALENAIEFLEALGYKSGGDIHDDLVKAKDSIKSKKGEK